MSLSLGRAPEKRVEAVASAVSEPPWRKPRKTRKADPSAHSASGIASARSRSRSMRPPQRQATIVAIEPKTTR
jgi:hypothetical protein